MDHDKTPLFMHHLAVEFFPGVHRQTLFPGYHSCVAVRSPALGNPSVDDVDHSEHTRHAFT